MDYKESDYPNCLYDIELERDLNIRQIADQSLRKGSWYGIFIEDYDGLPCLMGIVHKSELNIDNLTLLSKYHYFIEKLDFDVLQAKGKKILEELK